jgi:hypothetical protein
MKKLALVVVLGAIAVSLWRGRAHDASDPKLIFDRFWVDHATRDMNEQFQAFMINGERPFGHYATQTSWDGQWKGFHYHVVPKHDGEFEMIFPSSNERQRVKLTARTCNENGFDYCLEMSGSSRGAQRYYSKREWGHAVALPGPVTAD